VSGERTSAPALPIAPGMIDIEFTTGARMRITGSVDPAALSAAIAVLTTRTRQP